MESKIAALELVKQDLLKGLLGLKEEELELNDEFSGVNELITLQKHRKSMPGGESKNVDLSGGRTSTSNNISNSRRRKAPLFLPSEHDDLPSGVAFMTLANHTGSITSLDFSEPYGTLVTSSTDNTVKVWDLSTGEECGELRGHDPKEIVKCLQVEDELCITGSGDEKVKLWDLRRVEDWEIRRKLEGRGEMVRKEKVDGQEGEGIIKDGNENQKGDKKDENDPCLRTLEGHSKGVTALYFDDNCLVSWDFLPV